MFIEAWPTAQSKQEAPSYAAIESASGRQVPRFLNSHHSGRIGPATAMSTTGSTPDTFSRSWPSSNVAFSWLVPAFVLQAKLRLMVPASPRQLVHRIFSPSAAEATVAVSARSMPQSRIAFFILFSWDARGWGGEGGGSH